MTVNASSRLREDSLPHTNYRKSTKRVLTKGLFQCYIQPPIQNILQTALLDRVIQGNIPGKGDDKRILEIMIS